MEVAQFKPPLPCPNQPPSHPEWTRPPSLESKPFTERRVQAIHRGGLFLLASAFSHWTVHGIDLTWHPGHTDANVPTEHSVEPALLVPPGMLPLYFSGIGVQGPKLLGSTLHLFFCSPTSCPLPLPSALLTDPGVSSSQSHNFLICKIPSCQVVSNPPLECSLHCTHPSVPTCAG